MQEEYERQLALAKSESHTNKLSGNKQNNMKPGHEKIGQLEAAHDGEANRGFMRKRRNRLRRC